MRTHNAEELYAIKIRVQRDLLEEIRQLAQRDNRSFNNYLSQIMRQHAQEHRATLRNKK